MSAVPFFTGTVVGNVGAAVVRHELLGQGTDHLFHRGGAVKGHILFAAAAGGEAQQHRAGKHGGKDLFHVRFSPFCLLVFCTGPSIRQLCKNKNRRKVKCG